jgi:hypothetical protein
MYVLPDPNPDPNLRITDPRIRIRILKKYLRTRNTDFYIDIENIMIKKKTRRLEKFNDDLRLKGYALLLPLQHMHIVICIVSFSNDNNDNIYTKRCENNIMILN